MNDKIKKFQEKSLKKDMTQFSVGDIIRVHVKIVEGEKQRIQPFEGIVIGRKHSGINETFALRRISYGEGVERIFLLNSPTIDKIEVLRAGKVKRAKLYYLRKKVGKKTKVQEKIVKEEPRSTNTSAGAES